MRTLRKQIANAHDADQSLAVDDGDMADMVAIHQLGNMLDLVARFAGYDSARHDRLDRHFPCCDAVIEDGTQNVALGKHPDDDIALSAA